MSSPIAHPKRGLVRNILVGLHQRLSHSSRVSILSESLSRVIDGLPAKPERLSCLDIGCGDMQISERIGLLNPKTDWTCIDVHDLPEDFKKEQRWARYRQFDGLHIPFGDRSFNVALFCDVLHHDYRHAGDLLREAGRVARFIVVKDHFAHSRYARLMLLVMDIVGNWGYGVPLPEQYYSEKDFRDVVAKAGLRLDRLDVGADLYGHLPVIGTLLRPEWHFIAVLES